MKSVFSERFDYGKLDYLLECDASYDGEYAGLGWVIIEKPVDTIVLEGRKKAKISSTVRSETNAIIEGLKELKRIDENISSVIVRTDCVAVIEDIKKNDPSELSKEIVEILSSFDFWGIECVDREKTKRAHDLADHALKS